eukprot:scaffold128133_cov38-Prasinocladus_malaysianus.AAC.1
MTGEVSRYNADTSGAEPVRSEGKVLLLASVHDTFPQPKAIDTIWVSCKDFDTTMEVRKLLLSNPQELPKSCEYMDKDSMDIIDRSGRILMKVIELVGMRRLGPLWDFKIWIESLPLPFMDVMPDSV